MEGIIVYNNYNVLGKKKEEYRGRNFLELLTGLMSCSQIRLRYNWQKKRRGEEESAIIRCAVDGEIKEYDILITQVNLWSGEVNKKHDNRSVSNT